MYLVIGVRFKKAGKIYYFDPTDLPVTDNDHVIVETARGVEYGKVVIGKREVEESDVVLPLKKVIRIADERDNEIVEANRSDAKKAFGICLEKIEKHQIRYEVDRC